jgi:hypothetical protein
MKAFTLSQLAWSDENIRRKPQRSACRRLPVETVNGAKQRTDSYRVNNSGAVYHLGHRQGAAQIHRWIPLRPADGAYLFNTMVV